MNQQKIAIRDEDGQVLHELDLHKNTIQFRDEDGKLVTMDLGIQDVHIDKALANYAAGYRQVQGLADVVAPPVSVEQSSNKFFTWDKDDVFQDAQDLIVGPNQAIKEISPRLSNDNYSCVPYGIGSFVPMETQANADAPLDVYGAALKRCLNAIHLGRERRVASLLTASGSWTNGYTTTLGATAKWNAGTASNPVQDLFTAAESSYTPVSGIIMSEQLVHDFVQNAAVQKYTGVKAMLPPMPNAVLSPAWTGQTANYSPQMPSDFSALLGLPPIYVGYMKGKASASTVGYVWGNNVVLLYNEGSKLPNDQQSIATARTFRWTGADAMAQDGSTQQGGFLVRTYFDPRRGGRGGRMVAVVHNDAEKMTSVYAGGLIINAHQ